MLEQYLLANHFGLIKKDPRLLFIFYIHKKRKNGLFILDILGAHTNHNIIVLKEDGIWNSIAQNLGLYVKKYKSHSYILNTFAIHSEWTKNKLFFKGSLLIYKVKNLDNSFSLDYLIKTTPMYVVEGITNIYLHLCIKDLLI